MEAIIALLLVISTLTACAGRAPDTVTMMDLAPSLEENAVLTEAAPERLSYQVEMEIYENTAVADDGTELVTCRFEYPVMTACWPNGTVLEEAQTSDEEQALAAVKAFNDQFGPATVETEFQEMAAMAQEDLSFRREAGMEWAAPYTMELRYETYQTEQMISVWADYYSFTGGAHPNTVMLAWNFDLTTGQFFTPEVLAADGQTFSQAVQQELIRQSRLVAAEYELEAEEFFWSNYQDILSDWSSYAVSFNEDGMTVGFSPYELAAYAAGSQVYHLSYEQLMPYLSPHGLELLGLESGGTESADQSVR